MSAGQEYRGTGVLVTGAQGFLGSWLVGRLLAEGARVLIPQRASAESSRFRRDGLDEHCEMVDLDLLDLRSALRALNEGDVRVIFHLAAQTIVAEANSAPMATFDTNIRGTYNLIEACRLLAGPTFAPRVVIASSYHAYGRKEGGGAYSEDTPMRPSYPYDVSKACADILAHAYAVTYGMPVAVTRMANLYGGGDCNWSRIVPDTARALVTGKRPVIVSDGSPERDYLYVEDAVDAYLAIARSLDDAAFYGRAWNAGLGRPISVLELVQTLIAVSGSEVEPEIRGQAVPRGEIDSQYLDSTAIQEELGWAPQWDLQDGLAATYGWYKANVA